MEKKRVLVVQNSAGSGLRRFESWWREDGLELEVVLGPDAAGDGPALPDGLRAHDALVMLGGGLLPSDDEKAPWLPAERALAAEALERGIPVLGICLGGQLLAEVAGGAVTARHGKPERGSTEIAFASDAAAFDPLFAELPARAALIENHEDSITRLPAAAVLLGSSADHPHQAFRLGERAWGLQFHPEVAAGDLVRWQADELAHDGYELDAVRALAEANEPAARAFARAFAARFAAIVRAVPRKD